MGGCMWRGLSTRIALVELALALFWVASAQARQATPPPLSAYGALPSTELVQLSPSGDRLAFVTVVGEHRQLAVIDLGADTVLRTVGIGLTKVRDLEWIDDTRVLVTTSRTESLPQIGLDQTEVYLGQVEHFERRDDTPLAYLAGQYGRVHVAA